MFNKYKVLVLNGLVLFLLSCVHTVVSIMCLAFVISQVPCLLFLNNFGISATNVPIRKQVRNTVIYCVVIVMGMLLHSIVLT